MKFARLRSFFFSSFLMLSSIVSYFGAFCREGYDIFTRSTAERFRMSVKPLFVESNSIHFLPKVRSFLKNFSLRSTEPLGSVA